MTILFIISVCNFVCCCHIYVFYICYCLFKFIMNSVFGNVILVRAEVSYIVTVVFLSMSAKEQKRFLFVVFIGFL